MDFFPLLHCRRVLFYLYNLFFLEWTIWLTWQWLFPCHISKKLTERDKTKFVNIVKGYSQKKKNFARDKTKRAYIAGVKVHLPFIKYVTYSYYENEFSQFFFSIFTSQPSINFSQFFFDLNIILYLWSNNL
jgi:restriction endonuclease S subunit